MDTREWARNLLRSNAVILDSETADLHGEILDLAIINMSGEVLFDRRFKPVSSISPGAAAIHGLTAETLAGEDSFAAHYDTICELLSGRTVVIYNASYDLGCLRQTCRLHNLPLTEVTSDCAMMAYSEYVGEWNDYYGNYRWQRLPGGDHTALGDCFATLAVIREMAEED